MKSKMSAIILITDMIILCYKIGSLNLTLLQFLIKIGHKMSRPSNVAFFLSIALSILSFKVSTQEVSRPQLYCTTYEVSCSLWEYTVPREHPRYDIIADLTITESYESITNVMIALSKIAILSEDFCETFPMLNKLDAANSGIYFYFTFNVNDNLTLLFTIQA